ncbi:DUF5702 domain-containing protein [Lachnospiraceae bacterium OttesenSCG-928-D06]|nr:DUF5702 domain-containing protein [Lachnospiraceae bacterium OttesenSCG-928-D06]
MRFFCKKNVQGAISIFLVVILMPMMVFSALMVDTSRYNLAKGMVSSAGDLALNAALADYDTILKDVYGLFAMSQENGGQDVAADVKNYFMKTLISYGVVEEEEAEEYVSSLLGSVYEYLVVEDKETVDFLSMMVSAEDIEVNLVPGSALSNPDILEKQIVEYMKYRAPVNFGMSFLDSLSAFTKIEDQTEVIEKQVQAQEKMEGVAGANKSVYDAAVIYDKKIDDLASVSIHGEFNLNNYGNILKGYRGSYEEIHRLALIFYVTSFTGKWENSTYDLTILNNTGDYIVLADGRYMVPSRFLDLQTYTTIEQAENGIKSLYNKALLASGSMKQIYNTQLMKESYANDLSAVSNISSEKEQAIVDFQKVDSLYKVSYDEYINYCKDIDRYSYATENYLILADKKIDELDAEIEAITLKLSEKETELVNVVGNNIELSQEIASLKVEKESKEKEKNELELAVDEYDESYQTLLQDCISSINSFNHDIKIYKSYIQTVSNAITAECTRISDEFTKIYTNLEELKTFINKVKDCLEKAKVEIQKYKEKVDEWEAINSEYASTGADYFSEGNEASIEEANESFDMDEIEELYSFIKEQSENIEKCLGDMDSNFKYMSSASIKGIKNAKDIKPILENSSVANMIHKYVYNGTISNQECADYFTYTDNVPDDFLENLKQLINPYPCCKYMHYLNQTFQNTGGNITEAEKSSNENVYNKVKGTKGSALVEGIGATEGAENKYGYTYGDVIPSIENFPSRTSHEIGVNNHVEKKEGDKKEDDEKGAANTSSDLSDNKKQASSLLDGLSNAIETGRDKLFIMEYLFENFSYNTMIQDYARKGGANPTWLSRDDASVYKPYLESGKTSSGVSINAVNNQIYGAEIEYILFGDDNPGKNVTYTKTGIFAVRFLFNSVFAFTDTTLRNSTRTMALAVQAATLGVVPYQLVQVVLQLALAMGEAAVDLKKMEAGETVVIVKNKDTWVLSAGGLSQLTIEITKGAIETGLNNAANALQGKINEIIDASAAELSTKVDDISKDLNNSVNSAAGEVLDASFQKIESIITIELNKVVYFTNEEIPADLESAKQYVKSKIDGALDAISVRISNEVINTSVNDMQTAMFSSLKSVCEELLDEVKASIYSEIEKGLDINDLMVKIYQSIYGVKTLISNKISSVTSNILAKANNAVKSKVAEVQGNIKKYAAEATEEGKEAVIDTLNNFMDDISGNSTKFDTGSLTEANNNGVNSSTKASVVAFGYSDYLRLFVFIGLCASDKSGSLLERTADMIQLNIALAKEKSDLYHKRGSEFRMANARTYVSLSADVKLDLMFLNIGIFQRQVDAYNEELIEEDRMDLNSNLNIRYIGISGY